LGYARGAEYIFSNRKVSTLEDSVALLTPLAIDRARVAKTVLRKIDLAPGASTTHQYEIRSQYYGLLIVSIIGARGSVKLSHKNAIASGTMVHTGHCHFTVIHPQLKTCIVGHE